MNRVFQYFAGLLALGLFAAGAASATPSAPLEAVPPISGVVRDTAGRPLANAQVLIAALSRGAVSAADGSFTLRVPRAGTYHLDVSLVGYAPEHVEVTVPESGAEVPVSISLRPTVLALTGLHVTATPTGGDPRRVTQATTELSGRALERNLGTSVAQTLSAEPGLAVRYAGPAAATPVIRGLSGERVLVVQNGQRTGDLSASSPDHGLSVDPLAASRIEVVRGPAALLYGNNALGGVVNVIAADIPSSVPSRVRGYAAAQGESVSPGGAGSFSMEAPLGSRVAAAVRGGARRVDDVRVGGGATLANSYFNNLYGEGALGYVGDALSGGFSFGSYHFDYGLPAAPDADEGGVHLDGARQELKGRGDLSLGERGVTALRVDGTAQWYRHDEVEGSGEVGTSFKLNTQTLNATARTSIGALSGAFGASGLLQQYAAEGEEALTPPARKSSAGVFLFQELPLDLFGAAHAPRLQLGARYDVLRIRTEESDEKFGAPSARDFNSISGSVGVSVPVIEGVSLGVSAARAFRAPSVEELYSNAFHAAVGSFDRGNPDLTAEVNQGVEAVLRAQSHAVHAQLAAYTSRVSDFIAPTLAGDTTILGPDGAATVPLAIFTQADATMRGAEAKLEATLGPRLVLGAMGDVVRGRFTDGTPLPFMPAARVGGSARWDDGALSLGGELRHAFAQESVPEHELATNAYTLFGLDAGYRRIAGSLVHSVTLKVDNLFDVRYRDASSRIKEFAPNPGRNVSLVYRVVF